MRRLDTLWTSDRFQFPGGSKAYFLTNYSLQKQSESQGLNDVRNTFLRRL